MSSGNTIDNENKLIARLIGTKFDAMLALHNRLPELVRLSDFLTKLMALYDNLDDISAVEAALPELLELSGLIATTPFKFASYSVNTLPNAENYAEYTIYVSDGDAGQPCLAISVDGAWKRVSLGAAVSLT